MSDDLRERLAVFTEALDYAEDRRLLTEVSERLAELEAKAEANWQEYLAERSARMAANNREYHSEAARQAAEAHLAKARETLERIAVPGNGSHWGRIAREARAETEA